MKFKKILSCSIAAFLTITVATVLSSCSITINNNNNNNNQSNNNNNNNNLLNTESLKVEDTSHDNMFSSSVQYNEEILGYENRHSNKKYYNTLLTNIFGENFPWPTYKFNYNDKTISELTINLNNSNNKKLFPNGSYRLDEIIYSEGVDSNQRYNADGKNIINPNLSNAIRYNDTNWIINEINSNNLKRHPIAKYSTDYDNFILDDTKSIIKKFSLNTKISNYIPLGIYCPPGEIIEISFDSESLSLIKKYNNLTFTINGNYSLGYKNNKINNHYPFIITGFKVQSNLNNEGILRIGSPFGGSLSLNIDSPIIDNNSFPIINFVVKKGIEELHYVHNLTTIDDWNRQINDIENRIITAPVSSYVSDLIGTEIPFFKKDYLVNWNIKNINFPYDNMEKFYQFALIGGYFDNCEKSNRLRRWKLTGHNNLNGYAGLTYSSYWTAVFYQDIADFIFGNTFDSKNWVILHEYDHLHDDFPFGFNAMHDHGPTNVILRTGLSLLDDSGRNRNQFNLTGRREESNLTGWSRLNNSYTNLLKNKIDWYSLYNAILFNIGTDRFLNWIKNDIISHKDDQMLQIKDISDQNKLNFYDCAFSTFPDRTNAAWPTNLQTPTKEQKKIIDEIRKYPGIDFIGCLYAAGIYIYNSETNNFEYTNDVQPAFEIPPLKNYTFDFDKYINSSNPNFEYTIKVPNLTKYGSRLIQNGKSVTYIPKIENLGIIDEFDLDVIPTNFIGKPSNYVPSYKFKIKIRQATNSPVLTGYRFNEIPNSLSKFLSTFDLNQFSSYATESISNINEYSDFEQNTILKMEFKLFWPKAGKYKLYAKKNVQSAIYLDGQLININEQSNSNYQFICDLNLNSNNIHSLKIILSNTSNKKCGAQFYLLDENDKYIDLADYLISPIKELEKFENIENFATIKSNKFSYKKRWINFDGLQQYSAISSPNQYFDSIIDKNRYKIIPSNLSNTLTREECNKLSIKNQILSINRSSISFNIQFNSIQDINGFLFLNSNNTNYFPTNIKIYNNNKLLYTSDYIQNIYNFESKSPNSNTINIFNKLTSNLFTVQLENTKNKIELDTISPINKISNLYSVWSNKLQFSDNWKTIPQGVNISSINTSYKFTNLNNEKLEFDFMGNGFKLFGTLLKNLPTSFDIFVDDVLLDKVNLQTNIDKYGTIIYQNNSLNYGIHKVKIINNQNSVIYLEGVALLGDESLLINKK